jgi:hypothetical protein
MKNLAMTRSQASEKDIKRGIPENIRSFYRKRKREGRINFIAAIKRRIPRILWFPFSHRFRKDPLFFLALPPIDACPWPCHYPKGVFLTNFSDRVTEI